MYDPEDELSVSPEEREAYRDAGSRALRAPLGAKERSGGKYKNWNEIFIIRDIKLEGEMKNPERPGDKTGQVLIVLEVDPSSSSPQGDQSPNVGKKHFERFCFNISAWGREPNSDGGHAKMTDLSFAALKSLLQAFSLDPDLGMNITAFCRDVAPELKGRKVEAKVSQRRDEDGIQDQVRTFISEASDA